ncbi:MAG: hypothetical protein L0Y73_05130 [Candidatus Aminicenantes bacterium]|nr:hypothetical protein [Candidatus Aminicenantes bacterium]
MKIQDNLYSDIIRVIKNNKTPEILDVELQHINDLKKFDAVECHIVLYPYSRKMNARHFEFIPFEEYVHEIASHHRSAYTSFAGSFNNIFGLLLGLLITIVFLIFKPADLFSVESIAAVFGAYFVGKQLWDDIENLLIDISKNWRIRYMERYYFYKLEKHTTLSFYSQLAKKRRYGAVSLLPEKMDFNLQNNSQTLRLQFNMKDLSNLPESGAHILSIHINPELLHIFNEEGFMFGLKFSFNKRFLGITRRCELFQSLDKDVKGCLDETGAWINDAVFYRHTLTLGRVKYFMKKGILQNKNLLDTRSWL